MVASYLVFSYNVFSGFWYSGIGTLLIIFFAFLVWRQEFLYRIGIKIKGTILFASILLVLILTAGGYGLMNFIASRAGVMIQYVDWRNYIHDSFYTLNEEMILGAVLLGWFRDRFKKLSPVAVSVLVAILFAFLHYLFYRWIFLDKGILSWLTLSSLVMVGILRNNLILATGHVWFSWAFHASWMAVMFGTFHYHTENLEGLAEYERFNLYLGSPLTFAIIATFAFISFGLFRKKYEPASLIVKP